MNLFTPTTSIDNESAIRAIVRAACKTFAGTFAEKHLSQLAVIFVRLYGKNKSIIDNMGAI